MINVNPDQQRILGLAVVVRLPPIGKIRAVFLSLQLAWMCQQSSCMMLWSMAPIGLKTHSIACGTMEQTWGSKIQGACSRH